MGRIMRSPLFLMALTIFIDFTGFGLVIPLLPFWAQHLGANPFEVGLILTIYALAQFLFTPVLGSLSDRYGRRPIILASLAIEALAFALTALAPNLLFLLLARFIGGLGASNIGSAQAVVSDVTPPHERAKGMGAIGAAIGLGFVVGPALGGILAPLGAALPFWVAMGVALLNALLVFFLLPETHKSHERTMRKAGPILLISGWQKAARYPVVVRLVLINFLFTVAFSAMEAIFPLFAQANFHWGAAQNGYAFTYVGFIVVIMQGGLVGRLVKRFGERSLLIAGLALLALGLGLLAISSGLALLLIALGVLSIGDGAVTPTSSALLSFSTPGDAQGELLGLSQGAGGLARVLGPMAAGSLFLMGGASAPFISAALLALVALAIALPHLPKAPPPLQQPTEELIEVEALSR